MSAVAKRSLLFLFALAVTGCTQNLDRDAFQKRAEAAYVDANPGFRIYRRKGMVTTFYRGDQVVEWDAEPYFAEYTSSGKGGGTFISELEDRLKAEAKARRRTLIQAGSDVIPIIKSEGWVAAQDLGAIGPKSKQREIRFWRKRIAEEVYVLLGVPEEMLGYRYVPIAEVEDSKKEGDHWLSKAIENLEKRVGTSTGSELRTDDGRMLVYDFSVDAGRNPKKIGISGLILSPAFRARMTKLFNKPIIGAATPNRDVLVIFDADEFTAVKPVRAKAHQSYESNNHPGFRGLLAFDNEKVWRMEASDPEKEKKKREKEEAN